MDAVSGLKDWKIEQTTRRQDNKDRKIKRAATLQREPKCVAQQRGSLGGHHLAIFATLPTAFVGGHSYEMAQTTCNCLHHREGTTTREKTVKVLTVSSRSLREHGGNGVTPALESPKEEENVSEGRLWIPTGETLKKACARVDRCRRRLF